MDKLGRFEGLREPDPKENFEINKQDLKVRLEKYKQKGNLDAFVKNLNFTIENDPYEALLKMIDALTDLPDAEALTSVFNEAENKLLDEKNRERSL